MESTGNTNSPGEVTQLLHEAQSGDRRALDRLFQLVYGELRRIANRELRQQWDRQTIYTTALVHEAYLKLAEQREMDARNRVHFFAIAARAMRQVLIDYARRRMAQKRGGGLALTTLTGENVGFNVEMEEVLALDQALTRLDQIDPRLRKVVEYRFFGGLSGKEIAGLLGITERTVERDWMKARAWLYKELYPEEGR
jgi:RNA polymerase sigma factor (TIGR02999 family)